LLTRPPTTVPLKHGFTVTTRPAALARLFDAVANVIEVAPPAKIIVGPIAYPSRLLRRSYNSLGFFQEFPGVIFIGPVSLKIKPVVVLTDR
jgi:hypothetical protein